MEVNNMNILKFRMCLLLVVSCLLSKAAFAVPAFQVYIEDAYADTIGQDEDTWFTHNRCFDLIVAGAYGPDTIDLAEVTLVVSVPKDETGSIFISSGGSGAALLAEKTLSLSGSLYNPDSDADLDLLTNQPGNDGYGNKGFLPEGFNANNHHPFKESVSNFVLYSMGDFENITNAVSHFGTGEPIEPDVADGQEKGFMVNISGFTYAHFDVYGYEQAAKSNGKIQTSWRMNPGSADATYLVPEPVSFLLLGVGGFVIRRKNSRYSG